MKPYLNIDEIEEFEATENGNFQEKYAPIGDKIGAKRLGYSVSIVPPGKKVCPFHNHRITEEMFLVLEGSGTLRFGDQEYPIKKHDVIACPPGGHGVAHQIVNTSDADIKYFCLSTNDPHDICEYPDSKKILSYAQGPEGETLRHIAMTEESVDYFTGES